jgi:hypothetical protein
MFSLMVDFTWIIGNMLNMFFRIIGNISVLFLNLASILSTFTFLKCYVIFTVVAPLWVVFASVFFKFK